LMDKVQELTGHSTAEREANMTPYRVIADHGRAATFLIADGVIPGNTGRNYVCRMIVRRAARFGSKIGLIEPFLAKVAETVIENYGEAYPDLVRNRSSILDNLSREERRFHRTVEAGLGYLEEMLAEVRTDGERTLDGEKAFDLYATHGLPFEISRDIARELGMDVDESGFRIAMEEHRLLSGAGKAFGPLGGEDVDVYREVFNDLVANGKLDVTGVQYDPYLATELETTIAALVRDGESVDEAGEGELVEVVLPRTGFYVEAGGQVSDTGTIDSIGKPRWEIQIVDTRRPAAGMIVHYGKVIFGTPKVGDQVLAAVDHQRRRDIMRNHSATHLLHAELQTFLGSHARQAGSLVSPDRLRFDFTHPEPLTQEQLQEIETSVNDAILEGYALHTNTQLLAEAIEQGAMALFGEKYGETVRTVTVGGAEPVSFELCGGTHVEDTAEVGLFLITSEGSAAAGVRRIEAVTGRGAFELVQRRFMLLNQTATYIGCAPDDVPSKAGLLVEEKDQLKKQVTRLRQQMAAAEFNRHLENLPEINGIPVLTMVLPQVDADGLRQLTDRFRQRYSSGVAALGSVIDDRPLIIVAVTEDLLTRGIHAGELAKTVAQIIGGSGGGRPTLAQAGGKQADKLAKALEQIPLIVEKMLQSR
ncbi:MAG: alanine--tRNA ligase, partial [Anaerolineaceae bacterium]|nr:alanine--tRNA ligase [Anaerolineaceae bacterium]